MRVLREGAPESWRCGTMTPVPKQANKPLGQDNARGGFSSAARWESFTPSTAGATLRRHVQSAALPTQLGGFPCKTIEFGNHFVYQRAPFYKRKGIPSAIFFLDVTAAFNRALPELVFGPPLDEKARAVLLGAPSSCIEPSDYASRIQAAILDWGAPQWLHRAITGWHTDTFFRVRHTERTYRLVSGVRPGDPLADLIFNACMTGFIKELRKYLVEDGVLVSMQDLGGNPLQPARSEDDQDRGGDLDLDGPTWVDDQAVFTIARDPNDVVHNIRAVMVTLEKVAARHGVSLNTKKKQDGVCHYLCREGHHGGQTRPGLGGGSCPASLW